MAAPKASKANPKAVKKGGSALGTLKNLLLGSPAPGKKATASKKTETAPVKSAKPATPAPKSAAAKAPVKSAAAAKPAAPAKGAKSAAPAAPKATAAKGAAPAPTAKEASAKAKKAANGAAKGAAAALLAARGIQNVVTDAGEAVCREVACEGLATSAGYCRLHYIKNWKKIKRKELILREKKLNQYIEELVAKYPDKYIEAIRQDLASDKDFAKVIYDLDLDESVDEFDVESESVDSLIDNIKRDFDDEGESY